MAQRLVEIGNGLEEDYALIPADYGAKEMFVIELCVTSFGLTNKQKLKNNILLLICYILISVQIYICANVFKLLFP